ncbi:NAD(P)-dependent oxidoreductase [Streptomyces rugosispiralis]|uniref:NAD(P)-dependent oxidoreductase n=1 Tax=Streptomyces rugosispiralis TaxID=2967341 RepID=A0ABT1UYQ1_9ACTN|nr:NAD(P)-dependent oxidoreductase [Streptomyces rugosispiralis]MCQ8190257.1 NAD(P)-dependent oxidoreductase [Streptomyces rugosispiralis]
MKVTFVGVGAMGLPMARHILRRFPVTVFDPDSARTAELAAQGATAAVSAAEAARGADVVVVMVATPAQLDRALFGDDGVHAGLPAGSTVILMSSVGTDCAADAGRRLEALGAKVVDAPVTGGASRAETGELTVLAGAAPDVLDGVRPVLNLVASRIALCGGRVGDGQAVKLVNQLLCSVHLAAAGEALQFARALGLDPVQVLAAIEPGAASSFMLSDRGPRMLSTDTPPVRSAVDIFVKDSSLVLAAARKSGAVTPLAEQAAALFARAGDQGLGRHDDSSVIRMFQKEPH